MAKRKVKQAIDAKRNTLSQPLKEPFSETFDDIVARMPPHVRDRVMMRNDVPSKSMERNAYVGLYAHEFKPTKCKDAKYREPNNAAGRDAQFSQTLPRIPNVDFKSSPRGHFSPGGVFGVAPHYLLEARLIKNENDLTTFCSKYKPYNSPFFGNWADHDLDEFIKKEVATQETYDVNYKQVHYNDMIGVPDFTRYPKRPPAHIIKNTESHATSEKIVFGKYKTLRSPHIACPFGKLMPRDNLYQRLNGLPRQTKEEMIQTERKNKAYVSSSDFLPNSYMRSPKRSEHSNSYKTQSLGLFNPDMHESLADSLNMSSRHMSFASCKRNSPSAMGSTESTFARTVMPSEELLATHHRSGSGLGRHSALDHTIIDYDSIFKYGNYQTPQGENKSPVRLKRGGSTLRTKNSEMVTTENANETTMAGDSPMKLGQAGTVKDGNFRLTI